MSNQDDSDRNIISQLQTDLAVVKADVKSGNRETARRLGSIEDAMRGFAFVKQSDFDKFQSYVESNFASNESIKPMKTLFWAIITALILGLITLAFAAIQTKANI